MHEAFMIQALELAKRGAYSVHPNPMVGCIIVQDSEIIGQGYHEKPGALHAEIHALNEAGSRAQGSSVYVNLEPCSHFGRTPPCAEALINAGIKEVFIACQDPNPLVAGQGIIKFQKAGISVHLGLMEEEAKTLNRFFFHYITTKTPYIIGKWAMSLDGKMAVNSGDNRQLSNEKSMLDLHELRHRTPGILIGAATALIDNPALTVRLPHSIVRQPQRIVVSTRANLPTSLKLFDGSLPGKTWLVCAEDSKPDFPKDTTEIIYCKTIQNQIDLISLMTILGERELAALLVEGGRQVLQSFFNANLVNEVVTYLTPWIIGNLNHKIRIPGLDDIRLNGIIKD